MAYKVKIKIIWLG